jgi:predicted transcriptional regulator
MIRTQIQITDTRAQKLKELAASQNKSVAELIRQGIDVLLEQQFIVSEQERRQRALAAGLGFIYEPQ